MIMRVTYSGTSIAIDMQSTGSTLTIVVDGTEVYSELVTSYDTVADFVAAVNALEDISASIDTGGESEPDSLGVGYWDLAASEADVIVNPLSILAANALMTWEQAERLLGATEAERLFLESLINSVSSMAERYYARRVLRQQSLTLITDGDDCDTLWLPTYPVATAAVYVDATRTFAAASEIITLLYPEVGKVVRENSWFPAGHRNIKTVYVGGYDPVPDDLVMACAESVGYQRGRLQQGGAGIRSMSAPNGINTTYELTLPMNAQRTFEAYKDWRA